MTETVLVLTAYDLSAIPVVKWLSDRFRVVLLASRNAANQLNFADFTDSVREIAGWRWVDDLFGSYQTVEHALRWHEQFGIRHVVCLDETGLIFAARLRELLGVSSGQRPESALAYRSKSVMYDVVAGSVPVPEYLVASSAFDVLAAVNELGLPVVVKPEDGLGSRDTFVLRDRAELQVWLRGRGAVFPNAVLVQRYVDAEMYHVDGVTTSNEVYGPVVSKYGGSTLGYQRSAPLVSTMEHSGSPVSRLLTDCVRRVVKAMPDTGGSSFHAEFFVAGDDVWFCEIASRTGGAGVGQCYELATGLNLFQAHALLQCDRVEDLSPGLAELTAVERYGWYLQNAPEGVFLGAPGRCDVPGVVEYAVLGKIAQRYDGPKSSVDAIQRFVVELRSSSAAESTFGRISDWCAENNVIADGGSGTS